MTTSPSLPWRLERLADHATVKARLGWKGLKAEEYVDDGFIFLAAPNLKGSRIDFDNVNYITEWRYRESPEIQLQVGDVLLVKDGSTLGIAGLVTELPAPTTVNGSIAVIRPRQSLDSGFLYYQICGEGFQRRIRLGRSGLGVPHLFQADLREFPVSLPPLSDQRRIAEILSTVDEAIDHTEALIAKTQQIKTGLMHDLFTRGVTPDGRLRPPRDQAPELYKQSPLGWIPRGWSVCPLGSLCVLVTSGSRGWARFYSQEGASFIRIGDLSRHTIDLRLDQTQKVAPPKGAEGTRTAVQSADVLVSITADLGLVGVVPSHVAEAYVNQHIALVRTDPSRVRSRWVAHYLAGEIGQAQIRRLDDPGTKAGLNLPTVRGLSIALPGLNEQTTIAAALDAVQGSLRGSQTETQRLFQFKRGLSSALLCTAGPAGGVQQADDSRDLPEGVRA